MADVTLTTQHIDAQGGVVGGEVPTLDAVTRQAVTWDEVRQFEAWFQTAYQFHNDRPKDLELRKIFACRIALSQLLASRQANYDAVANASASASDFIEWCALRGFGIQGWPEGAHAELTARIAAAALRNAFNREEGE